MLPVTHIAPDAAVPQAEDAEMTCLFRSFRAAAPTATLALLVFAGCGTTNNGPNYFAYDGFYVPPDTGNGADTAAQPDTSTGTDTAAQPDTSAEVADDATTGDDAADTGPEVDVGPSCVPTEPPTEACDNIDNDCNGLTDDGACDDGNPCTDQACDGSKAKEGLDGCTYALPDGKACDDGSACTVGDSCQGGICQAGTAKNCNDDNSCTIDKCKVATGECDNAYIGDGKFCNDGLGCTNNDTCQAGKCQGIVTSTCDDGIPCTKDGCDAIGTCTHVPMLTGPCEDSNPCTTKDQCFQGICTPGELTICDDGKPCTDDYCDALQGGCVFKPKLAGTPCNDGLCASGGSCDQLGTCVGLKQLCDDGKKCTIDSCDKATGGCTNTALAVGTPCDDGELCTVGESCNAAGECAPPPGQKGCDDGNPCTQDLCDVGTKACTYKPVVGACDDGDGCTQGEACVGNVCKPGAAPELVTIAGDGTGAYKDGKGTGAQFYDPRGMALAPSGVLFLADTFNHRIRRVKADGTSDTFTGTGTAGFLDGNASVARFQQPADIAIGKDSTFFVADRFNHRIRSIAVDGTVGTVAGQSTAGFLDGVAGAARFNNPEGVAVDAAGNIIVADRGNHRIRRIDANTAAVITLAGDGSAAFADGGVASARFNNPSDVFLLANGDVLVADTSNHRIRLIQGDKVSTVAGSGTGALKDGAVADAQFNSPASLVADAAGRIYVADAGNHSVRLIEGGQVSTVLGNGQSGFKDGAGALAQLSKPAGLLLDKSGQLYVADAGNHRIRAAKAGQKVCNDGNPCTKDSCDKQTVASIFDTRQAGDACDDGSACTVGDVCDVLGQCKGQGKSCDDNSPCTDDACDPVTGDCVYKSLNKACDDGDACTKGDVCVGGACVSGPGAIDTLAGSGSASFLDGKGTTARFYYPEDVAIDAAGNAYIADTYNHRIRKITKDGTVTTLAGSGSASYLDGPATTARFYYPAGVAVDSKGTVYVADRSNHRIRMVAADGTTTTLAGNGSATYQDGKGTAAKFNSPNGVDVDPNGNVYVADTGNQRIRKIDKNSVVTTVAGQASSGWVDGPAANARFSNPYDVVFGTKGEIFVADYSNHRIRVITPAGDVTTLAGNGTSGTTDGIGAQATFSSPCGMTLDANGNLVVVTRSGHRMRRVTPAGEVATIAGSAGAGYKDGAAGAAQMNAPSGVALAPDGVMLVTDRSNHRVRRMASTKTICVDNLPCTADSCDKQSGQCAFVTIAAGGGCSDGDGCTTGETCDGKGGCSGGQKKTCDDKNPCTVDSCNAFSGECVFAPTEGLCSDGLFCTVNDRCSNGSCVGDGREVSTLAGQASAGLGDGKGASAKFNNPRGLAVDLQGNVWVADYGTHAVRRITSKGVVSTVAGGLGSGFADGSGSTARFTYPTDVANDGKGGVYVADRSNQRIRHITAGGLVTTFAGNGSATYKDGVGTAASFSSPEGIAYDAASSTVYVADTYNHRVRKIDKNATVKVFAGNGSATYKDGVGTGASFYYPRGIAVDGKGRVWIADSYNHRVRRIEANGTVTTMAGSTLGFAEGKGVVARFNYPYGIAITPDGTAWVADRSNYRIRAVTDDGTVTTVAGLGTGGFKDADALDAQFNLPQGIAIDASFNVFVGDSSNHRIRKMATPFNDCDDGTECTANACDETKDTCSATPVGDGNACIDGKPCLANRLCNQGFCVGGVPKDCDDKNSCTIDACDALSGDCTHKADSAQGCTVSRRVFITSDSFTPNFGGIAAGHAKCAAAAKAAGLGGSWLAWLSDSSTYPSVYHKAQVPYRRLDGALVALNWNDLVDGTLDNPIEIDETGAKVTTGAGSSSYCGSSALPAVWTGTNTAGNRANSSSSIYYCGNWTTNTTSSSYRAASGLSSGNASNWTTACTTQRCNYKGHLYCFEQSDYWSK